MGEILSTIIVVIFLIAIVAISAYLIKYFIDHGYKDFLTSYTKTLEKDISNLRKQLNAKKRECKELNKLLSEKYLELERLENEDYSISEIEIDSDSTRN